MPPLNDLTGSDVKTAAILSAVVLLLTACATSGPAAQVTPSTSIGSKTTASASPTAPTGQCSLPVFSQDPTTNTGSGFFVSIPSGSVRQDASGQISYDQGGQRSRTASDPVLYGGGLVGSYDGLAGRWVPVDLSAISPDGLSYAYGYQPPGPSNAWQIRFVDVRSGKEHVAFTGPSPNGYDVVGFTNDGIYFTRGAPGSNGLWRLDPSSGDATPITSTPIRWRDASHGAAWATQPNPQHPVLEQGGPLFDQLLRVDLTSRATSQWLTLTGQFLVVIGVDADGHALVQSVSTTANRIIVVTTQGTGTTIYSGPGNGASGFLQLSGFNTAVPDGKRIWFGTQAGVFAYDDGTFAKVADSDGFVAGTCQP